ncbi:MAG TPA: 2-hydroxyhepta-2,4-diene-1,7-dioate isomerase [Planctomycetaceae bacterium]|nr:2-hydroxyhepta-2,4-diene-1,7-dioate isomerase [Planctomycetaceae bacterium]HCD02105.1 2-hydroxyhepta-2,4-diene-1,7-dioate isomerase [Planctomycetaceae bacterium]|tara:strand:+ start:66 stop:938 length:873 start_codon:yes stop_codon:yes gene_type:complete
MRLARVRITEGTVGVAVLSDDGAAQLLDLSSSESVNSLADLLHSADPVASVERLLASGATDLTAGDYECLAPIDRQEVWAAGVTYKRSQVARMEESESAATHYDKVYTADRPELFLKATPHRVSGPGDPVRVRADSNWTVPEPEFALVISPDMRLVGYSIGNDMSARDIEGENPLYLPQAKCYREAAGLGPCVLLADGPLDRSGVEIELAIERGGEAVFGGTIQLDRMARTFEDLIDWLGRENVFPDGVVLMTGTGIVPPDEFTLEDGDSVSISITGIGTLSNPVAKDRG